MADANIILGLLKQTNIILIIIIITEHFYINITHTHTHTHAHTHTYNIQNLYIICKEVALKRFTNIIKLKTVLHEHSISTYINRNFHNASIFQTLE